MRDAWQDFSRRLSGPHVSFSFGDVARWKQSDFQALCDLNLLCDGKPASHLLCPECSGHWAEVTWTEDGMKAFIFCSREGRPVDVDPEHLRQWEPNKERFVALLAAGLGITDRALNLVAGQLWRLGRCMVARRQRDIFFAAIAPDDLSSAITEIRRGYGSVAGVLLLPSCAPDPGQNSKLRIVDLSSTSTLRHDRIALDVSFIEEQFAQGSPTPHDPKRTKKPGRAIRSHRLKILQTFKKDNNLSGMEGLARYLGVSKTALYGMAREDTTRYRGEKLDSMLRKLGCSRAEWNRAARPATRQ